MRLMRNQGLALEPSDPEGGGRSRTNVLVSVWISTSCPNSHQLFKRCASHLNSIPIDRARERRAAACEHRLFLIRRRHSSAVEQLFRKQQVLGSNPSVGSSDRHVKPAREAGFRASLGG